MACAVPGRRCFDMSIGPCCHSPGITIEARVINATNARKRLSTNLANSEPEHPAPDTSLTKINLPSAGVRQWMWSEREKLSKICQPPSANRWVANLVAQLCAQQPPELHALSCWHFAIDKRNIVRPRGGCVFSFSFSLYLGIKSGGKIAGCALGVCWLPQTYW